MPYRVIIIILLFIFVVVIVCFSFPFFFFFLISSDFATTSNARSCAREDSLFAPSSNRVSELIDSHARDFYIEFLNAEYSIRIHVHTATSV